MRVPLLAYLAIAAEAAPLAAALVARRTQRGVRAWILAWCALLLVVDGVNVWLALHGIHNLWLFNLLTPASVAVVLWTLSGWQTGDLTRLTMRLAIVPFLLIWAALTWAVEDTSAFTRVAGPMASLIALAAAAFTLVAGSHSSRESLPGHDWFWVSSGMALYFGTSSALGPLSALLVASSPALLDQAFQVKALLDITAFLLIARGVTCPAET